MEKFNAMKETFLPAPASSAVLFRSMFTPLFLIPILHHLLMDKVTGISCLLYLQLQLDVRTCTRSISLV